MATVGSTTAGYANGVLGTVSVMPWEFLLRAPQSGLGGSVWSSCCWCCHRAHGPAKISGGTTRDPICVSPSASGFPMRRTESLFSYWMARISLSWPVPSPLYRRMRSDARVPPNTGNGLTETEFL